MWLCPHPLVHLRGVRDVGVGDAVFETEPVARNTDRRGGFPKPLMLQPNCPKGHSGRSPGRSVAAGAGVWLGAVSAAPNGSICIRARPAR